MTDRLIGALVYHGPLIAVGCLVVGLLGAATVVALDAVLKEKAEVRIVERSHMPMGGEDE